MASMLTSPGGKLTFIRMQKSHQILFQAIPSLSVSGYTKKKASPYRISASMALPNPPVLSSPALCSWHRRLDRNQETVFHENLDEWMRDSVVDIVKNLKKAPLLVSVYSEASESKFKTELAIEGDWPLVKDKWKSGEAKSPDGLIFVQQLLDEGRGNKDLVYGNFGGVAEDGGLTRAWGVLVQRKGWEIEPVCYLLKTCSVGAGLGMGLFCTHFCLVRVNNFRESALRQLEDCWLLQ